MQYYLDENRKITPIGSKICDLKLGKDFGMILTDAGQALTWGDNRIGQLGRTCNDSNAPAPIDLAAQVKICVLKSSYRSYR